MFVRVVFLYFKYLISGKSCLHGRDDNNDDIIKIYIIYMAVHNGESI